MATIQERINRMKADGAGVQTSAPLPSAQAAGSITERLARMKADGAAQNARTRQTDTVRPVEVSPTPQRQNRTQAAVEFDLKQARDDFTAATEGMEDLGKAVEAKRRITALEKELEQVKDEPGFAERVLKIISGGAKSTGASMTNMVGTLYEMGQAGRDEQNQALVKEYAAELEYAQRQLDAALEDIAKDPGAWTQGDIQSFYNVRDDAQRKYDAVAKVFNSEAQKRTTQEAYAAADQMQQSSAQDIQRAKQGLGTAGKILVDAGASMTQIAGDVAGGALTGGGMVPFAMRAFGGGTQQARQEGADLKGQLLYGGLSAAKEVFTEKLFNIALPFSRAYGGGTLDDAVEQGIRKAVERFARTETGKRALGGGLTLAAGAVGEGLEEFIGDWMEWQMPKVYGGDTATASETLGNSLYDFLVGAASGVMGGAVSPATYRYRGLTLGTAEDVTRQATEMARQRQVEKAAQAQKTAPEGAVKADTSLFDRRILQNFNQARKSFVEFAKAHFPTSVVNMETGKEIGISRKGIDKFLSGNIPYEKYASGFHIPELIERAHKVAQAPNDNHRGTAESVPTYEYFDSTIEIDGKQYSAHIRVKNTLMGDKYYGHTVSEVDSIEIERPTRTSTPETGKGQPENTGHSTSDLTVPQTAQGVKGEDAQDGVVPMPVFPENTPRGKVHGVIEQAIATGKGYGDMGQIVAELGRAFVETDARTGADALSQLLNSGEYGVTEDGKVYRVDSGLHIDRRDSGGVGARDTAAFQYQNPQLHVYYAQAAQGLLEDLANTTKGERFVSEVWDPESGVTRSQWDGVKRSTTREIAALLDDEKLTYNQIQKAAEDIIAGGGAENYAAAKRVELILDRMLSQGWVDATGRSVGPNESYIREKAKAFGGNAYDTPLAPLAQRLLDTGILTGNLGKMVRESGLTYKQVSAALQRIAKGTAAEDDVTVRQVADLLRQAGMTDSKRFRTAGDSSLLEEADWNSLMASAPMEETKQKAIDGAERALEAFYSGALSDAELEAMGMVRTETPEAQRGTLREMAEEEWGTFRRRMVDVGDSVAKLGREIGDRSLYSYYNFARASSNAAGSWLMRGGGQTDVMGRKVGQSLADLLEPIRERGSGYYEAFQEYLFHKHNIDRMSRDNTAAVAQAEDALKIFREGTDKFNGMTEDDIRQVALQGDEEAKALMDLINAKNRAQAVHNKPVFGYEVTADDSKAAVIRLETAYPEFRELAEQVYQYNHNLMQYRVESGLLTQEQADHIEEVYPHYVPTYRVQEQEGGRRRKRQGQRVNSTIGRAEGGTSALKPLHQAMAEQTYKVIREAAKNRFGVRLLDDAMGRETRQGAKKYIYQITDAVDATNEDTFDWMDDPTPKMENTFTVYKDGKAYQMTVDKGLYEGIAALSPERADQSILFQKVRAANDLFKALVTGYNPMFTAKNFARDIQEAGLYSKDLRAWAQNYPLALKEIAENGEWWQRYQALGGIYSSVFDYRQGYKLDEQEHSNLRRQTVDRVDALNMAVEQAPRLAEFMAQAKKNGAEDMDSMMDAMLAAADVTTNFGRSGTWGQFLNQTFVPFLNPAIQGIDKMGRTFLGSKTGKEWLKLVVRCAALGIAPAIINELVNKDEPEWEDVRDSDKDVYWLFPLKDGKYLRIPKGRDMSVIQMTADRIGDAVRGEDVDLGGTLRTAASQIAPPNPLENNILAAWMDADLLDPESPGKTWYGADIESQRLRKYEPGQRYDEDTDAFSKWLGGVLNLSPKKIHYLLDQYSGVVGDFVLPVLTPSGDKNPLAPFKRTFVLDSVSSNKISGEFYDTGDKITYARNGGDGAMAIVSRYWNEQTKVVSDIYAHIREIENSDLPNAEKQEQVRQAKAILNGLQKNAMEGLEAFEAAARKYYTGDDADALNKAYREANRETFGAEYALQLYDDDVYEKAVKAHKDGKISYDDFYNAYFAQKGIVGDKDSKGETIYLSASKKKKTVIDTATPGMTREQRETLYESFGLSEKVWKNATAAVDMPVFGRR